MSRYCKTIKRQYFDNMCYSDQTSFSNFYCSIYTKKFHFIFVEITAQSLKVKN